MKHLNSCRLILIGCTLLNFLMPRSSVAQVPVEAAIKGKWKSTCMDLGGSVYILVSVSFDGAGKSNERVDFYQDATCATATGLVKTNQSSYSLGPRMGQQGDLDLFPIDTTIQSTTLMQNGRPMTSGGAMPKQYDVISIKGDLLYMSSLARAQKGPITSPVDRPTQVDTKNSYSRQK